MLLTFDHGPIREVRLNRPPVNALSHELIVALRQALENAMSDQVRAIVLSGSAVRFSGGLDVPLLLTYDHARMADLWHDFYALVQALACSPIPIAAAITGHAPAGGTVLSLFCDWRIAAEGDFKIGLNEVQVGLPLPPIILAGLRRLVGLRQAERLAVAGLLISPKEALAAGLVDELAPPNEVIGCAVQWCNNLLALPREAMSATRRLARADLIAYFEQDLEAEVQGVIVSWWSPETQSVLQGISAKLGKKTVASS